MATADWDKLGQEAVGEIIEWTKGAKDFVSEQAPELVREVLAWGFWSHAIWAIACGLGVTLFVLVAIICARAFSKTDNDDYVGGALVGMIGALIIGVFLVCNVIDMFYVVIAPRVYLLEYLKGLVK